ncbi:DUF1631 domain-containing protein [Teredinibacter sp. KSP-S5-2]|uniref:DUF1631 domain-containing protein n=1 Tax=Teredinibacter sp. KSP-S5-2 TaxID=3034506 RepID=UPI00293496D6|nr:DUF1631 domain-containing protein [Teredinibacter sp. KSP-S5-2]WNO09638.1 DUF1631 domain-containing protein [Teredinibacter sp. KSP-S5-2]
MPRSVKLDNRSKVVHLEPENLRFIRARLARLPAAVHAVHEKGKQNVLNLLKQFFDHADDSLFELADKAQSNQEQNLFFDSMREVRVQRRNIEKQFSSSIDEAFANLVSPSNESRDTPDDNIAVEALSLVQNDDLEEMVAVDSSISRANAQFGELIQHLSLRLDSLVPVKVYQKNNPLGPDVLCSAFMDQAKKLDIDIKAKLVLFKLFDKAVVARLGDTYKVVNQVLVDHNVLPNLSSGATASTRPVSVASTASSAAPLSSDAAGQVSPEVLNALRGMFGDQIMNHVAPQPVQALEGSELLNLLSFAQRLPVSPIAASEGMSVRELLGDIQKRRGVSASIGKMDDEVINLVTMLFDFILEDRDLAPPMKALITRLQIPIIKVALVDKTFFTKGGHPARRLLNEMSNAAVGWQGDKDGDNGRKDPLYRKMDEIVRSLLDDFDSDVTIFNELLAEFTSFVDKEKRRIAVLERRTLDAEDGKAKAEVARNLVAVEIELRTINEVAMPEVVLKLINEAWSNVMFVTGLKYGYDSKEWNDTLTTLEHLVWSVRVPRTDEQRKKLIQLVPSLLKRLRAGLDTISYNPFEMSTLLKSLENVHLSCIRGRAPESKPVEAKPAIAQSQIAPAGVEPVKQPGAPVESPIIEESDSDVVPKAETSSKTDDQIEEIEIHSGPSIFGVSKTSTGKLQSAPTVNTPVSEASNDVKPAPAGEIEELPEDDAHMKMVANFNQGAWFEMKDGSGANIRCRLAAFIKPTGKYIFVNRNGMKVAEKSQTELAIALKADALRALDNSMLFDRALETVVTSLRKKT